MILQLNPPLPMETVKGSGWAHFLIDYGAESALLWVVFMDADGACWTVPNPEVRISTNWTMGRRKAKDTAASQSGEIKEIRPTRLRTALVPQIEE